MENRQTKQLYLELIKTSIRPPKDVWKNDPFEVLLENLQNKLSENDELLPRNTENINMPSSSEASTSKVLNTDARATYSDILANIYIALSTVLKEERESAEDEYRLLSLQELSLVQESFQFFVLAGILPFLEPGVGVGAASRSTLIKSWKLYDGDVYSQRQNLQLACQVIFALCDSNEALRVKLIKKFIDDFLAVRFELLNIGITQNELKFKKILEDCPKDLLISALMGLIRPQRGKQSPPQWLQTFCGNELSEILSQNDGLYHFLAYFSDIGGENWTDNVPMRKYVAKHIANIPKQAKSTVAYLTKINHQFMNLIDRNENDRILSVYFSFVDEVSRSRPKNAEFVIFDGLLRFWEIVAEKSTDFGRNYTEKVETFDEKALQSLKFLAKMVDFGVKLPLERILRISTIFLNLSETNEDAQKIMKLLKNVENSGLFFYQYVVSPCRNIRITTKVGRSYMIEEVGEEEKDFDKELWVDSVEMDDIGVARRLEVAISTIDVIFEGKITGIVLEMLAKGLEEWMELSGNEEEDEEANRFVEVHSTTKNALHAHLIVGYCFEKIGAIMSDDGFIGNDDKQLILLLNIVKNVLTTTNSKIEALNHKCSTLDVFRLSQEEDKHFELMIETSKMCIGMASCVIIAAQLQPELMDKLDVVMKAIGRFVNTASQCEFFDETLPKVINDGRELLKLMCYPDESIRKEGRKMEEKREVERKVNICEELMKDLKNEEAEVAIRGAALIQISKIFRKKNKSLADELIEMDVFEAVQDAICHTDSYIYLSAINCICEMACYDRRFLVRIIDFYQELAEEKDEKMVVQQGRIGEALGRVFRLLGEVSVIYIDRMAMIMVEAVRSDEEIIRASCLCAFGDFLLAAGGRGITKWVNEMLTLVDALILMDQSPLVRRAAVDLIRQSIKSLQQNVLQILGGLLRDIRRKIVTLWRSDRDDIVRLHAQLCMEELDAAIKEIFEEEQAGYIRNIKI